MKDEGLSIGERSAVWLGPWGLGIRILGPTRSAGWVKEAWGGTAVICT